MEDGQSRDAGPRSSPHSCPSKLAANRAKGRVTKYCVPCSSSPFCRNSIAPASTTTWPLFVSLHHNLCRPAPPKRRRLQPSSDDLRMPPQARLALVPITTCCYVSRSDYYMLLCTYYVVHRLTRSPGLVSDVLLPGASTNEAGPRELYTRRVYIT